MSASFTRKARYMTFGGLATLALGIGAQLAVVPGASSAEGTPYQLHQTPPIQNSEFGEGGECSRTDQWGWHFVATGAGEFTSLTATFEDGGTVTLGAGDFGPPSDKHAYVYTATDDTLTGATATIVGGDEKTKFVLSHTCAPTTTNPSPSATVSPTATASPTCTGPMPSESVSPTSTASPDCSPSPTTSVSPTCTGMPSESVSPTSTASPDCSPSPTTSVSPTCTGMPSESVSPTSTASPDCSPSPSESVSPTETVSPTTSVSPSESVSPTETVSPTTSVSPSESVSPTETVSPSESVSPTETGSPSESVSPTETGSPSESVSPTETGSPSESVSPSETNSTPGETVLPTQFTNTPSETTPGGGDTPAPTVSGVKINRPGVGPGALPSTGTPFPVGLLLLLGVGMVAGGLVMTVAGEPHPAGGKHRR